MKNLPLRVVLVVFLLAVLSAVAQVPHLVNYQGRVAVGGTNFDGTGQFKFALVNADGTASYWSNDGTSAAGSQPVAAVALPVVKGLYSVQLGDVALANMTALPGGVFDHADVRLRVWFNDGTRGFEVLAPDKRFAAVGYAIMAETVADGAVTAAKIAPGAIDSTHLAPGLILGGTTTGTFNGGLTGNVTGSAMNFSGSLAGDVIGTQGATVVASVGGSAAASVHGAEMTVSAAASGNGLNTLVKRDGSGGFSAGTITLVGGLGLPATTGAGVGTISQNGTALLQSFGTNNVFTGLGAGNFSLTGTGSTGIGQNALAGLTSGDNNIGLGFNAGNTLTTGSNNIAIGNTGLAGDSGIIRLGTGGIHTDTYLAGVVHGNGSGLTGITVAAADLTGTITGAQIAAGAVGSGQLAAGAASANLAATGQTGVAAGGVVLSATDGNAALVNAGYVKIGSALVSANAPSVRVSFTSVWTGSEMIVWGGEYYTATGSTVALGSGASYEVAGYAWTSLPTSGAPSARSGHFAVWSGNEMIVWGGRDVSSNVVWNGGRYRPSTKTWAAVTSTNAPSARYGHSVVSTGSEMIIWGGYTTGPNPDLNTGARYNPASNAWTATATAGAPTARYLHCAVWTGTEMIVWGGSDSNGNKLFTGARYNPATNTWTAMTTTGAPSARTEFSTMWTGSEMIIWGGTAPNTLVNDGGRYNPTTNTWTALPGSGAPSARGGSYVAWTGTEMVVWGGYGAGGYVSDEGRYNPVLNSWTVSPSNGSPSARGYSTAVTTGSEMIIWGGQAIIGLDSVYLNDGGRYNLTTHTWTPIVNQREMFLYQKP